MWNNTRLLDIAANLMFGLAAVIVLKLVAVAALNTAALPVRSVTIVGDVGQIAHDQVTDVFAGRTLGNFFAADLDRVRSWVEAVPGVRRARVRRVWPDRLEVAVEAHQVIARWSEHELVNSWGEVFPAESSASLPRFSGPPGTAIDVTDHYHRFRVALKPIGRELVAVTLTPRYAWELTLSDGLSIILGRDAPGESAEDRLARLVRLYPDTIARLPPGKFNRIDLRYANGFALQVPELPTLRGDKTPPPVAVPAARRKPITSASLAERAPPLA
jgi:cell division protein FtsQ